MRTGLLIALGVLNLFVFLLFGWDKLMARLGRWRISESQLLFWTACGGFGALLGMLIFRHKTHKTTFQWKALPLSALSLVGQIALLT